MVIAAVLCINVLWMAFELQLSGADTGYHIGAAGTMKGLEEYCRALNYDPRFLM